MQLKQTPDRSDEQRHEDNTHNKQAQTHTHINQSITHSLTLTHPLHPSIQRGTETHPASSMKNDGKSSAFVSAFNMSTNLIGSGMLALPWSLRESSLISGLLILCVMCVLNGVTMVMLAKTCEMARSFNYQVLGTRSMGRRMGVIIQVVMLFYTFSSCLSFVILLGDFVPNAISAARNDQFGLTGDTLRTYVILVMGVVILLPLSFIRNLHSLRFTSAISLLSIFYTIFLLCFSLCHHVTPISQGLRVWDGSVCTFSSVAIMNVLFTAHYNGPRFYQELKDRSLPRFAKTVAGAMAMAFAVYATMGIVGYLRFGNESLGNILNNFAVNDTYAIVARLVLAVGVSCSFPLCFHAIRTSIFTLFAPDLLITSNQVLTSLRYVLLTVLLVGINLVLGILLKQLEVVMIYKGSIFGCGVVYVFPCIMFLRLKRKERAIRDANQKQQQPTADPLHTTTKPTDDFHTTTGNNAYGSVTDGSSINRHSEPLLAPFAVDAYASASEGLPPPADSSDGSSVSLTPTGTEEGEDGDAAAAFAYEFDGPHGVSVTLAYSSLDGASGSSHPDLLCPSPDRSFGSTCLSIDSSAFLHSPGSTMLDSRLFSIVAWALLGWGVALGIVGLTLNIIVQTGELQQCN